jgi:hypothetical protein
MLGHYLVGLCGVLTIVCLGATDSDGDPFGRVQGVVRALTTEGGADSACTTPTGFPSSWCSSMQHVDSESLGILVELGIMEMLLKAAANNFPGRHLDFGEASCRADIKSREKNETRAEFRGLVNEDDARRGVSDLALKQIDSFVAGTGVLINLHITHHAGTTVCHAAKLDQACCNCTNSCYPPQLDPNGIFVLIDRYIDKHCKTDPADCGVGGSPKIQRLLEAFFFASTKMLGERNKVWSHEWRAAPPARIWEHFPWASERILTVLVVRDPLQRMLSEDGTAMDKYPEAFGHPMGANFTRYMTDHMANDYAFGILAGRTNPVDTALGPRMTRAKFTVESASVVLDQSCLAQGLCKFCHLVGWDRCGRYANDLDSEYMGTPEAVCTKNHMWASSIVRFGTFFQEALRRNAAGIELYLYAKLRALQTCPCECSGPKCSCGPFSSEEGRL